MQIIQQFLNWLIWQSFEQKFKPDINELGYIHNIYNPSPLIYTNIYML